MAACLVCTCIDGACTCVCRCMQAYARIPLLAVSLLPCLPMQRRAVCWTSCARAEGCTGLLSLLLCVGQLGCAPGLLAQPLTQACCEHVERRAVLRAQLGAAARLAYTSGPLVQRGGR